MNNKTTNGYFEEMMESGNVSAIMHDIARNLAHVALSKATGVHALHPEVYRRAVKLVEEAKKSGLNIAITDCFRDFEAQTSLYLIGRTKPGARVTNAKAGQSYHNYGLAFDVKFLGSNPYPTDALDWRKLATIAERLGLTWGGSFGDKPHFEYHPGFEWSDIIEYFAHTV